MDIQTRKLEFISEFFETYVKTTKYTMSVELTFKIAAVSWMGFQPVFI